MRTIRVLFVACLLGSSVVGAPAQGQVYEPLVLPLDEVGAVLFDAANDQLYVAEGPEGNDVLVIDGDGETFATISNLPGPSDVAVSADGSILWVAMRYGDSVVGYSTSTLAEVDRVDLPPGTCPIHVAESAGKLVVDPYCGGKQLLVVDLDSDRSTPKLVPIKEFFLYGASLAAVPAAPGMVIAAMGGGRIARLDVSGDDPVIATDRLLGGITDMALDPTGSHLTLAGGDQSLSVLDTADLRSSFLYSTDGSRPGATAWSADGDTIAAGSWKIFTYAVGTSEPAWEYELNGQLVSRGLEISSDGTTLYMVTQHGGTDVVELHTRTVGENPGSISGTLHGYGGVDADLGKVELYDDQFQFIMSVSGEYENYQFDRLEPGTYHVFFWNGDDIYFWDYFPRWWTDAPMYQLSKATPVVVDNGEDVTGVDMVLPALYYDMFGSVFGNDIFWLGNTGITRGCNPPENTLFCVDEPVTRGQMAAFLVRALGLTDGGDVDFIDDDGSVFEDSIEKLATAGITRGCNPPDNTMFCPNDYVTRGQLAAFLVRALGLTERVPEGFTDDDGSIFEVSIEKLAAAGITRGCNPPENTMFCPHDLVTRGQMAAFLHRALG